jgi:hypothetical protein
MTQSPNRSGNPYRADTLSDDFADVRELTFPSLVSLRRLLERLDRLACLPSSQTRSVGPTA